MADKKIVYIGDFDIRNENVQSFLVLNNGKVFNKLGYKVDYIGINRKNDPSGTEEIIPDEKIGIGNSYLELPDTLNFRGILKVRSIFRNIIDRLDDIRKTDDLQYVITYQSPTYSVAVKKIAVWCHNYSIPYIVNCADLPIFSQQPLYRRWIMKLNWDNLHKVNKKYADGVISVSRYINDFYKKVNCEYVIVPPLFDIEDKPLLSAGNDITAFVYAGCPFKNNGSEVRTDVMKDRLDYVIDIFLEIGKRGIPFCFKIIGIDREDYLVGVPRHRIMLEGNHNIEFMGVIDHDSTLKTVSEADYSISYREENTMNKAGFPTKIVESVSVGTPVVINPISDVFDYVEEGISGFSLSGVMENDISKVASLCRMSKSERSQIKSKCFDSRLFSIGSYVKKFQTFFDGINCRNI